MHVCTTTLKTARNLSDVLVPIPVPDTKTLNEKMLMKL